MFDESYLTDTMSDFGFIVRFGFWRWRKVVNIYSKEFYDEVKEFVDRHEVWVDSKYKRVGKKVRLVALSLSLECGEHVERASMQPYMRDTRKIGHEFMDRWTLDGLKVGCEEFLTKIENEYFKEMIWGYG